jgi:tRNA(adenine34) deaminase
MLEEVFSHEYFMGKALDLAIQAAEEGEVPIGAVVVHNNKIIGKGYNQTEKLKDVTAHAEMLAMTAASDYLNSKYLDECTLYVTIEPCTMCAGAIQWARLGSLVWGADEPKFGFNKTCSGLLVKTELKRGVLEEACAEIMRSFFKARRK